MGSYYPQSLQPEREQHIQDMLLEPKLASCKSVSRDGSVFDLQLVLPDGKSTTLRISLPPQFPQDRPVLTVTTPVDHPKVDSTGRVHTREVEKWEYPYSSLTETVKDAVGALGRVATDYRRQATGSLPPSTSGMMSPPPQPTSPDHTNHPPHPTHPAHPGPPRPMRAAAAIPPPHPQEVNSIVRGELQGKSAEELEKLMAGEGAESKSWMEEVIKKLQVSRAIDALRHEVSELAQRNTSMETSMSEARNQVAIVRSSELQVHKQEFEGYYARQQAVMAAVGPNQLVQVLEDALSAADHRSDTLKEEVKGDMPVDKFLDAFITARKEYHTLQMKRQAIDGLLGTTS